KQALSQTQAVFEPLRERIAAATEKLENVLANSSDGADPTEVEKAKEAVARAKGG
ncbi:MAG: hypothetical protein Q9217_003589, partial [Psora testacea]